MSTAFPPDDERIDSTARDGGQTGRGHSAQHDNASHFGGPTPRTGGHGDHSITGHHVSGLRLCVPDEPDTPLPAQWISCGWLMDNAPSHALRDLEADPPLSACGRHLIELE